MKSVITGCYKSYCRSRLRSRNFLKVGAGAETNIFGSATLLHQELDRAPAETI
jgi:hypothetical protein